MLNFRFAKDYLLHWLKGKTRHGTHSPFVYRLLDNVIYDFSPKKVYDEIENQRKALLSDERIINITDLGAGSRVNSKIQRKVSEIAKNTLRPPKLAQLLYRFAVDCQPMNIIELGTGLGTTSLYLQKAAPNAKLYTLEGCPEVAGIATEVFKKSGETHIEQIMGNFDDTLPGVIDKLEKLDFVFVDGNHQKAPVLKYFKWCLPKVHENTLLIFDDIYWSEGMKDAWREIKAHPEVSVTIDLFWMGLVYFKKGQVKEDFVIKF